MHFIDVQRFSVTAALAATMMRCWRGRIHGCSSHLPTGPTFSRCLSLRLMECLEKIMLCSEWMKVSQLGYASMIPMRSLIIMRIRDCSWDSSIKSIGTETRGKRFVDEGEGLCPRSSHLFVTFKKSYCFNPSLNSSYHWNSFPARRN